MLSPFRLFVICLSSVCLSVTLMRPTQPVKFLGNFSPPFRNWPSIDTHGKFYGDCPRGTPSSGSLNARGWPNIAIFYLWNAVSPKRRKIGGKLTSIANRKSYMSFRLVQKSVTLNDLERRNAPYFALFYRIW